ncbi:MAG: nucleoside transporter [Benniella sp.]|nr:MAG: nucleoside transporter [Benniella sp.]
MTGSFFTRLNRNVARSRVGKHFRLEGSGARRECHGFAYIVSVNALIVTDSGGPCVCNGPSAITISCLATLKLDLITATAAIACISWVFLLIGLAPGMGLNAYFHLHWLFGVRQWLARSIPQSIKIATGAGIGLYLILIGAQSSVGIGLVGGDRDTLVTLTGCVKDEMGSCIDGTCMRIPTTWMGILGFAVVSVLLLYRAVLFGVLSISTLSWFRGTTFTNFPYTDTGDAMFDYFKKVVTFHPIQSTLWRMDFKLDIWRQHGDFDGPSTAFLCDATAISIGACFGVPPVTAFIESGAGITEGGKTGLTSIMTALLFFISLFFSPIFASFPPWATSPALIIVGSMMAKSLVSRGRLSSQEKDLKEPWAIEAFTLTNILPQ